MSEEENLAQNNHNAAEKKKEYSPKWRKSEKELTRKITQISYQNQPFSIESRLWEKATFIYFLLLETNCLRICYFDNSSITSSSTRQISIFNYFMVLFIRDCKL